MSNCSKWPLVHDPHQQSPAWLWNAAAEGLSLRGRSISSGTHCIDMIKNMSFQEPKKACFAVGKCPLSCRHECPNQPSCNKVESPNPPDSYPCQCPNPYSMPEPCDPSDHLQESPDFPGPKFQKSLEKSLFGGLEKSPGKYPKKFKKYPKNTQIWTFFGYVSTFSGIFGDFFADLQKDFFETFLGFRARKARRLL